jgi:hypothetical protein
VQYRVKPFPDPGRPEETTWMTKEQLIAESLKPSTHWVEAGSGHVGKLFVEILGCDGLPNMDLSANPRDATDAFSCIVFEDAIVNTAIIPDCLSPRWMPWCRRAFAFNITHPSSTLLIGVFDFDPEKSPLQLISRAGSDLHDPIGRIVIRPANYRQNVVYTTAVRIVPCDDHSWLLFLPQPALRSSSPFFLLVSSVLWRAARAAPEGERQDLDPLPHRMGFPSTRPDRRCDAAHPDHRFCPSAHRLPGGSLHR